MSSIFDQVERNIDSLAAQNVDWSHCASEEDMLAAREGHVKLHFFRKKELPAAWLPPLHGLRVLALAGAGGGHHHIDLCGQGSEDGRMP